jgi:hypothetical protein
MRTLKCLLALLALALGVSTGQAQSFTAPITGGGGSQTTGSVTVVSASGINLNGTALSLSSTLSNLNSTGAVTNKWNSWQIWGSSTVSNSMFAENAGLGIVTNSTSFSGLIQSIVNRRADGFHILIQPNYYASNSYSIDSTIYITNGWGIIEGFGNPDTMMRGTAALNGPAFQVGSTTTLIGGIVRFKDIRIEMDNAGANGVGVKIVDCAEPVFERSEVTGFRKAGIELASTNYMHWGYAQDCWFVSKYAGAKGVLVSDGPLASVAYLNHFEMYNCQFGTFGGGEAIYVEPDAAFPNFKVVNSTFKYSSGTMSHGIAHENGRDAVYNGNKFIGYSGVNPILFAASGGLYSGVTNLNPSFYNNHSDGTAELIVLGQFVTNVAMSGNSIRGSGPVVLYEDVASNGRINNLDPTELRLGYLPTNSIPYIDAYGVVRTASFSGLNLVAGVLTATGSGTPGGTTTTMQYNQGGSFAGSSNFVYDQSLQDLTIWSTSTSPTFSIGYTNGSTGKTNDISISGMTVTTPNGNTGVSIGIIAAGVLNSITIGTNYFQAPYSMHSDIGTSSSLFRSLYLGSNAIVGGGLTVTGAVSVVGSASIPMMGVNAWAGDATAFTRATNSPAATGSTNDLQISRSTAAAGQTLRIHSTASGQNVITNAGNTAITVSGTGNGNTNYVINLVSGDVNDFYMGSSNVVINAVYGGVLGTPIYWNAFVTNLSGINWGIGFSAVTNRWRFSGVYGTNSPSVLTNGTCLQISGRSDGTNTLVGYTYYAPGL